jgi:glutaredoxin 3
MHAIIYTKDHCPYCTRAKALFDKHSITYDEKIIGVTNGDDRKLKSNQSLSDRTELLSVYPDAKTVPQIWLDGRHIGGHDDLVKHLGSK